MAHMTSSTEDAPRRRPRRVGSAPCLSIVHGLARGQTIVIGDRGTVVGCSAGTGGVVLGDPLASRIHFEVVPMEDRDLFLIRDLGSRNGTAVNGVRVSDKALASGDVIRAGNTLLVYRKGAARTSIPEFVQRAAGSDVHVLILKETGVGKEVVARGIHEAGCRRGPFVAVNCAAVPRDLLASELFGHVRGAFSGAEHSRAGLFASARGGTAMLDEIGDMPLEQQPALLRVLETRAVRRIGGDGDHPIDARIIAATNVDLRSLVTVGRFRGDLYARLAQLVAEIPLLRARREEILPFAMELGEQIRPGFALDADAAEALLLWNWPHNVRELKSLIGTLCLAPLRQGHVTLDDLSEHRPDIVASTPSSRRSVFPAEVRSSEVLSDRARLADALMSVDGNFAALARTLGTSRTHVYRWIRKLKLDQPTPSDS